MGAPFPPRGWGLWVLDGIVAVWQVVGRGSPSCPLSPRRGQARLAGSGQRCSGPVGLDVSGGPVAKLLPAAELQLG